MVDRDIAWEPLEEKDETLENEEDEEEGEEDKESASDEASDDENDTDEDDKTVRKSVSCLSMFAYWSIYLPSFV